MSTFISKGRQVLIHGAGYCFHFGIVYFHSLRTFTFVHTPKSVQTEFFDHVLSVFRLVHFHPLVVSGSEIKNKRPKEPEQTVKKTQCGRSQRKKVNAGTKRSRNGKNRQPVLLLDGYIYTVHFYLINFFGLSLLFFIEHF